MIGETTYNLPDYLFSSGNCAGTSRFSFTYWSNPFPGSTGITTQYAFNPKDFPGDGLFNSGWVRSFRSDHVGGLQFLFADASHGPVLGSHRVEIVLTDNPQYAHDDEEKWKELQSKRVRVARPEALPLIYN